MHYTVAFFCLLRTRLYAFPLSRQRGITLMEACKTRITSDIDGRSSSQGDNRTSFFRLPDPHGFSWCSSAGFPGSLDSNSLYTIAAIRLYDLDENAVLACAMLRTSWHLHLPYCITRSGKHHVSDGLQPFSRIGIPASLENHWGRPGL